MAITNPLDISGLQIWYDGQDSSSMSLTGDNLTVWNDKSGNVNHLDSVVGAPAINAFTINNNQAVNFTLSDLFHRSSVVSFSQPLTVIVKAQVHVVSGNNHLVAVAYDGVLRIGNSGQVNASLGTVLSSANALVSSDTPYTFINKFDGINSEILLDGVSVASGDANTRSISEVTLGGFSSASANVGEGLIGEVIIYDKLLTPIEIADITAYLDARWADTSVNITTLPPTGMDYIQMTTAEASLPADSILKGDTYAIGDQVAFETTANHSLGTTGTVVLDEFGVPTITGTSDSGDWTFNYWIKDANGDNSISYLVTITVA